MRNRSGAGANAERRPCGGLRSAGSRCRRGCSQGLQARRDDSRGARLQEKRSSPLARETMAAIEKGCRNRQESTHSGRSIGGHKNIVCDGCSIGARLTASRVGESSMRVVHMEPDNQSHRREFLLLSNAQGKRGFLQSKLQAFFILFTIAPTIAVTIAPEAPPPTS